MANETNHNVPPPAVHDEISIAARNRIKRINAIKGVQACIIEHRRQESRPAVEFTKRGPITRNVVIPIEETEYMTAQEIGAWKTRNMASRKTVKTSSMKVKKDAFANALKQLKMQGMSTKTNVANSQPVTDIGIQDEVMFVQGFYGVEPIEFYNYSIVSKSEESNV